MTGVYTDMDLAWVGGLMDGEGSILLSVVHKNANPAPVVCVANTSLELLQPLKEWFGGAIVTKKPREINHSISYDWKVCFNRALFFLGCVQPFLRHPKLIFRSRHILDNYKNLIRRNGKYTEAERATLADFYEVFYQHPSAPRGTGKSMSR